MNYSNPSSIPLHRCLVTGANGFVGQSLCKELKEKGIFVRAHLRKVTEVPIPCDEIITQDLRELNACSNTQTENAFMEGIDTVFHLAGVAHTAAKRSHDKEYYWKVNVEATEQLLHLAHQSGVLRFIYFSSVKASDEPKDHYGASKKAAEDRVLFFGKKYGIHVCILRPALVYGRGMKGNLAMMLRGIRQGWFPVLPETNNRRSLISLTDLIEAALCVANAPQANGKVYTITDGQPYSSRQLYDAMRKSIGKKPIKLAVPYFIFQMLAKLFDALQYLLRHDLPFNSDILNKLLGSAYYPDVEIQKDLDWRPKLVFFNQVF